MTDDDLLALLDSTLGPTLSAAGFDRAQGGWTGVTFCASETDFAERFEWLPQARSRDQGGSGGESWQGARVDLEIEFDQTTGLLGRVHLESQSLAATVYAVGQGALAAELKAAYALPLPESLATVVRALETIFTPPDHPVDDRDTEPQDFEPA